MIVQECFFGSDKNTLSNGMSLPLQRNVSYFSGGFIRWADEHFVPFRVTNMEFHVRMIRRARARGADARAEKRAEE